MKKEIQIRFVARIMMFFGRPLYVYYHKGIKQLGCGLYLPEGDVRVILVYREKWRWPVNGVVFEIPEHLMG